MSLHESKTNMGARSMATSARPPPMRIPDAAALGVGDLDAPLGTADRGGLGLMAQPGIPDAALTGSQKQAPEFAMAEIAAAFTRRSATGYTGHRAPGELPAHVRHRPLVRSAEIAAVAGAAPLLARRTHTNALVDFMDPSTVAPLVDPRESLGTTTVLAADLGGGVMPVDRERLKRLANYTDGFRRLSMATA